MSAESQERVRKESGKSQERVRKESGKSHERVTKESHITWSRDLSLFKHSINSCSYEISHSICKIAIDAFLQYRKIPLQYLTEKQIVLDTYRPLSISLMPL